MYISTYTGIHMDPTAPLIDQFQIRDIAHALPLLCRGNGHVKTFWSVGQHCLCCAREAVSRGYSDRVILACLLHDAGECYLSDVPRPVKQGMPEYCAIENRLLAMVYQRFLGSDLTDEEKRLVDEIDDAMLWYDLEILLDEPQDGPPPKLNCVPDYSFQPFAQVEGEYLSLFRQVYERLGRPDHAEETVYGGGGYPEIFQS